MSNNHASICIITIVIRAMKEKWKKTWACIIRGSNSKLKIRGAFLRNVSKADLGKGQKKTSPGCRNDVPPEILALEKVGGIVKRRNWPMWGHWPSSLSSAEPPPPTGETARSSQFSLQWLLRLNCTGQGVSFLPHKADNCSPLHSLA